MIEHMFEDIEKLCANLTDGLRAVGLTVGTLAPSQSTETLTQALEMVEGLRRVADTAQLCVLTELARRGEERGPDGLLQERRTEAGEVAEMAADLVAMTLGCSDYEAQNRCGLAVRLTSDLDGLLRPMLEGRVAERTVRVIAEETADASPEGVAAVLEHVLAPKRGTDTPRIELLDRHDLRQACRRMLERTTPGWREAQADHNRRTGTDVRSYEGTLGTTEIVADLPTEVAVTLMAAIDEVATERRREDPTLLAGPARALALADLTLRGVEVSTHLTLGLALVHGPPGPEGAVDAPWLGGVEIPRIGWIPGSVVQTLAERLDTRVTRALLDPDEGTVVETSVAGYVPPPSLKRLVRLRDTRCRMWGCDRPAVACDLDHAVPYPEGETSGDNLSALCRHHHRVKHAPGWSHTLRPDGTTEWVSPGGSRRITWPTSHAPTVDVAAPEGDIETSIRPGGPAPADVASVAS